jgi:hypothetical protein
MLFPFGRRFFLSLATFVSEKCFGPFFSSGNSRSPQFRLAKRYQRNSLGIHYVDVGGDFTHVDESGWPDWANFAYVLSDCFLWPVYWNLGTEVEQILEVLFSTVPVTYILILTKKWLGNILGDFFANSSGHTETKVISMQKIETWHSSQNVLCSMDYLLGLHIFYRTQHFQLP